MRAALPCIIFLTLFWFLFAAEHALANPRTAEIIRIQRGQQRFAGFIFAHLFLGVVEGLVLYQAHLILVQPADAAKGAEQFGGEGVPGVYARAVSSA